MPPTPAPSVSNPRARYSAEAVAYFLDPTRICNERYLSRLLDTIRTPIARPLLEQLLECEALLLPLLAVGCPSAAEAGGVLVQEPHKPVLSLGALRCLLQSPCKELAVVVFSMGCA